MKRHLLICIALVASAPCIACNETGSAGDEASAEERATRSVVVGSKAPRGRTEDGYDVIFANPGGAAGGPERSRPGERDRARERESLVREPTSPDPHAGGFTLEEAVDGMPVDGQLVAEINTDLGTIFCDLHADRVPNTVANFIGLARGKRAWWDARAGQWVYRPAYRMTKFHRVIPGFMIQGGDYLGDGSGTAGYTIPDEIHPTLASHDRAGQLCMANTGPNENGAQFFITDGPAAQLDGSYTVFGQCKNEDIVSRIARVPQSGEPENAPLTDVVIERILIRRVAGGSANATRSPPQLPEGFDPERPARGASPGPNALEQQMEERRRLLEERERQNMR